jgi:hypothetical protein
MLPYMYAAQEKCFAQRSRRDGQRGGSVHRRRRPDSDRGNRFNLRHRERHDGFDAPVFLHSDGRLGKDDQRGLGFSRIGHSGNHSPPQPTSLATAPDIVTAANGGVSIGAAVANRIMVKDGTITAVVGVGSTTGTWKHCIRYQPLTPDSLIAGN